MAIAYSKKKSRALFVTANKYQREIIIIVFLPSFLIFVSFICIVFIGNPAIARNILHIQIHDMGKWVSLLSGIIVVAMCSLFFLFITIGFVISNRMVGGFERIIREMDEIIAGRSRKLITGRPEDTLTKDLLKRINVFIEAYVKYENKKS